MEECVQKANCHGDDEWLGFAKFPVEVKIEAVRLLDDK